MRIARERMNIRPLSRERYWRAMGRLIRSARRPTPRTHTSSPRASKYADLYEKHAVSLPPDSSIGGGDFERMGRIELAILIEAGLSPSSSLFDFGCGTGRLAVHAVPYLCEGNYVGSDIAPTMLQHAVALLTSKLGSVPDHAQFITQSDEDFPTTTTPDFFCAYSVFTHMEHEDTYRYLCAARRVSGPGTVFVASCLPIDLVDAQHVFLASASRPVDERWSEVRNVVTSRDLFTGVARLAGWDVCDWFDGDGPAATMPDGSRAGLGQSLVVMRPSAE